MGVLREEMIFFDAIASNSNFEFPRLRRLLKLAGLIHTIPTIVSCSGARPSAKRAQVHFRRFPERFRSCRWSIASEFHVLGRKHASPLAIASHRFGTIMISSALARSMKKMCER